MVSQNPFDLVLKDLEYTKDLAINNILKTEYKELQDASQYNMMLKGKNFRSAILFTMARATRRGKTTNARATTVYFATTYDATTYSTSAANKN